MTEPVSIPEIADKVPPKQSTDWETFFRCVVLLLGIFLGLIVGVVVAAAAGWFQIGC